MAKELLPLFGEHLDRTISSKPSMEVPLSSVLNFTSKQPTLAVNPILKHASEHLEAIAEAKANKNNSLLTSLIEISKEYDKYHSSRNKKYIENYNFYKERNKYELEELNDWWDTPKEYRNINNNIPLDSQPNNR